LLVSGSDANGYVRIWSMNRERVSFALPRPIDWSSGVRLSVRSTPREVLSILQSASGARDEVTVSVLGGPKDVERSVREDGAVRWAMSHDGSRVAALLSDESVRIHAVAEPSGKPVLLPPPPTDPAADASKTSSAPTESAQAILFSPDGRWLATSKGRRTLLRQESGPASVVTGHAPFAFSHTSETFANMERCESIHVWHVAPVRLRASFPVNGACPSRLALSPDGSLLLAILPGGVGELLGGRATARLWDVTTKRSWVLQDYSDRSGAVAAFAPDGRTLATVGRDGGVHLWDPHLGRRLLVLAAANDRVRDLAFSADGLTLFALDEKGVRAFRTRGEDESELTAPTAAADRANSVFDALRQLAGGHR
jgi:WD40 repeat protein